MEASSGIPPELHQALQAAFHSYDEDGSGSISLHELITCLRLVVPSSIFSIVARTSEVTDIPTYGCRELGVKHLTDTQIERKFHEVRAGGTPAKDWASGSVPECSHLTMQLPRLLVECPAIACRSQRPAALSRSLLLCSARQPIS